MHDMLVLGGVFSKPCLLPFLVVPNIYLKRHNPKFKMTAIPIYSKTILTSSLELLVYLAAICGAPTI